jgi:acylphosphatase
MNKRAHLFIYGDVTGVGFRAWTLRKAKAFGLTGFVRNASSETVEVLVEGQGEKVMQLIDLCKKGPDVAWVERVSVKWEEVKREFVGFQILR